MPTNAIPKDIFWPEFNHFKRCGLSNQQIADKLGVGLEAVEARLRRAKTEPVLLDAQDAPLNVAVTTAESVAIALHDATFTLEELHTWIAHRCTQQPVLMASVVMALAAWAPKDAKVRERLVEETLKDRETEAFVPLICSECSVEMAPRHLFRELGVRRMHNKTRCEHCYHREWKARKRAAS